MALPFIVAAFFAGAFPAGTFVAATFVAAGGIPPLARSAAPSATVITW